MELIALTVNDFAALTASDAPAPGGGSISALCGALSAALVEMVANLTVNKEKYKDYQQEMSDIIENISSDRKALLVAVDDDTRAFDKYMAALKLPKGSEERKVAMQEGLKEAALVPLSVAKRVCTLFPSIEKVLTHGNTNAVTDAMVRSIMCGSICLPSTMKPSSMNWKGSVTASKIWLLQKKHASLRIFPFPVSNLKKGKGRSTTDLPLLILYKNLFLQCGSEYFSSDFFRYFIAGFACR